MAASRGRARREPCRRVPQPIHLLHTPQESTRPPHSLAQQVTEESPHSLCFTSVAEESQMVSFNFHVDEHGDGSHHDKEHMEYVTKEHTDRVEELLPFFFRCSFELVGKLHAKANDILDQQRYAITREAVHRETAESTNARVMWWTFAEVDAWPRGGF
ncbi:Endosomal protein P24B [Durusdinium trenchii]|uniref:Endosomal protein P24B n=1 Tax=Durusdinium trenchii TaxID=1381693 RepID=A0ABP0QLM4_9DINO